MNYTWTIWKIRTVPGDPSLLRDVFWKLTVTDGTYTAEMGSSFSLVVPVPLAGLSHADLVAIAEKEISSVHVEKRLDPSTGMIRSTQPDGFDGNALELYRHRLAQELARMARPKPMELEIPV